MPANLTQAYFTAEKKYRQARTPQDKLETLQEMLRVIPKHKGTDHMQADLKKKISKAREDLAKAPKSGGEGRSYYVAPEGIGQVFLLGPPNGGKSSLMDALTNAKPAVADYPFTTRNYLPGMMRYHDVWIQLVDMPPISSEYYEPWIPAVARYGDLIALVLDLSSDDALDEAEKVIEILENKKVRCAGIDDETGQFDTGIASISTLVVGSRRDAPMASERAAMLDELWNSRYPIVMTETGDEESLNNFNRTVYEMLGKVRVYTKERNKKPDLEEPFVLKKGDSVMDLAGRIHKDIAKQLKFARVWGEGKYDGQRVNRDYVLEEGNIIELNF